MSARISACCVFVALLCPSAELRGDETETSALQANLARLKQDAEDLWQERGKALDAAAEVLKERKTLDRTDAVKVEEHNQKSQAAAKRLREAQERLDENHKKQQPLRDRLRLPGLKARKKALESEVAILEERVRRQQELMKRLGEESLKDVKELEAAAEESRKADLVIAGEVLDQLVGMAGEIGGLSKALDKIDMRRFGGPKWKDLRDAVKEMRETAAFFDSRDVKQTIKRIEDSKEALKKTVRIANDPKSATKVDEVVSDASKLMQWAVKECELKTKVGKKIEKLLKDVPIKELEGAGGPSTLALLGQASMALSLGETAINCWEARGEQMLLNREVDRITGEVERRNALIKSYSRGGSHFKTHEHDVSLLKAGHEEKRRVEAEIKDIEVRLARNDP